MANELQIPGGTLTYNKGVFAVSQPLPALSITVVGKHNFHDEIALSTSDTNLNKGNIGTIGWAFVRNEDATNTVLICADGVNYVAGFIIQPGQWYNGPWGQAAIHAKSGAGTPNIEYLLIEQ